MLRFFCSTIVFVLFLTNAFSIPLDSLGIEKKNGKILVQHRVEKGETLYSILKRYDCSEKDFFAVNTALKEGDILSIEQVIEVPYKTKKNVVKAPIVEIITTAEKSSKSKNRIDENGIEIVDIPEATPKEIEKVVKIDSSKEILTKKSIEETKPPLSGKTHLVISGQNLFSISKLYNLKVWQLREWNELKNDTLQVNQVLLVEKPANFIAKTVKKDTLKSKIAQVQAPAGDIEKVKATPKIVNKPVADKPQTTIPNAPGGKKFNEMGIAEVIDAGASTNKYLALHPTAPVGTLIKVANQANGQSVWVKVIGKLNNSGDILIKISPKAFEKLSPRDKRIRAELSYSVSN